jgi:hypothetical protein
MSPGKLERLGINSFPGEVRKEDFDNESGNINITE